MRELIAMAAATAIAFVAFTLALVIHNAIPEVSIEQLLIVGAIQVAAFGAFKAK